MPHESYLENGDYVPTPAGTLERAADAHDALLRRILLRLKARRGGFVLAPEFGSRLHLVAREKPSARRSAALRYAAEALEGESFDGRLVAVLAADLSETGGALMLTLTLSLDGERETVTFEI